MDEIKGKRVLVTGAAGFVGANLVRELLGRGSEVHALVRPGTDLWRIAEALSALALYPVDLTDPDGVKKTVDAVRPEIIFHLAARGVSPLSRDQRDILKTNVLGTFNLLEATSPLDYSSFVYLGSSTEYGTKSEPMRESDLLEPVTFFGATKAAATLLCRQFATANNRPVVILRSFVIYGYWESPPRLISTTIGAALNHRELSLTAPGYRHDFIFIEDLVEACMLTLKATDIGGEIINVGSGRQTTNEEVVDLIQALTGQKINIRVGEYPARPGDKTFWVGKWQGKRIVRLGAPPYAEGRT